MKLVKIVWAKWKIIGTKIALFQSRVILTIFYFIMLLPLGLVFSLFKDELRLKKTNSTWRTKKTSPQTLSDLKKLA